MFISLSLILTFISACFSAGLPSRSLSAPSPNIKALFSVPPGESLTYPPTDTPGPKPRKSWIQAYQNAKNQGLIPSMPKSKIVNYEALYPCEDGQMLALDAQTRNASFDVISAPAGMAGISFDDGPQPPSLDLLKYLKSQGQKATHFMIGSRIMNNPDVFKAIDNAGEHLAVHTWSHPMMTSLTDLEIVGELGWTMQLIHDRSQNGVICSQWRPPYGDIDPRVQAIAKYVFGLLSISWLYDPRDWCLSDSKPDGSVCSPGNGPQNFDDLKHELDVFVRSSPDQGLIILEHEQSQRAVQGFKYVFPLMKRFKWITKPIPDLFGLKWYQ